MNSEGFKGVPGVPEGWELVAIRHPVNGDFYVYRGLIYQWENSGACYSTFPIIRKVETPKRFRPFANGAEYMASPRRGVAADWKTNESDAGFFAVVSVNASFVWVAHGEVVERFYWREAFEKLVCRHADGSASPFGVEVTSE